MARKVRKKKRREDPADDSQLTLVGCVRLRLLITATDLQVDDWSLAPCFSSG
jgi:hypothetical protein